MKKPYPFIPLIALIFFTCNTSKENLKEEALKLLYRNNLTLTDELVLKYISAYKKLKQAGPSFLEQVNKNGENPESNIKEFENFSTLLKESGFKDYQEFVITNAKIAWAFSIQQAGAFTNDMEGMKDDGLTQIDEQLKNPDVPQEAKDGLIKAKEKIISSFAKDKKWANVSIGLIKNLVTDNDLVVINRHEKELLEAFTGVELPEVPSSITE